MCQVSLNKYFVKHLYEIFKDKQISEKVHLENNTEINTDLNNLDNLSFLFCVNIHRRMKLSQNDTLKIQSSVTHTRARVDTLFFIFNKEKALLLCIYFYV